MLNEDIEDGDVRVLRAKSLLPVWFVPRMMTDCWQFGLILSNNSLLCISHINNVVRGADGSIWIDAEMLTEAPYVAKHSRCTVDVAPTSRTSVSINAAHVVAAFELADT